jgi:lipoprotein-releasing system ATP-binding protein
MITAQGILKKFNQFEVLKGVNLEIKQGEIVSIVGASGAGKSTLLHILGTLIPADGGTFSIDGQVVNNLKGNKLARFRNEKIGFVFQFHQLLPEFTAAENVAIPALIRGDSKTEAINKANELLTYLGLGDRSENKPSQLSGGEQQRVAVARALINKPAVVFADEPTGNLDSKNAHELHHLFLKLRNDFGQTFLIVTHNEALAAESDRQLTMLDGLLINQ